MDDDPFSAFEVRLPASLHAPSFPSLLGKPPPARRGKSQQQKKGAVAASTVQLPAQPPRNIVFGGPPPAKVLCQRQEEARDEGCVAPFIPPPQAGNAGAGKGRGDGGGMVGYKPAGIPRGASSIGVSAQQTALFAIPPTHTPHLPPHPLLPPAPHLASSPGISATLPPPPVPIPALILSCLHHTHLHSQLFARPLSAASLSPGAFGLIPTTVLSTQIPENDCIDLATPSVQLGVPIMVYHLGRDEGRKQDGAMGMGGGCMWSENPAAGLLVARDNHHSPHAGRRGRMKGWKGALCEDVVVGDCVVVRRDRKPMGVEEMEGLLAFLRECRGEENNQQEGYGRRWLRREQFRDEGRVGIGMRGVRKRVLRIEEDEGRVVEVEVGGWGGRSLTPSDAGYESGEPRAESGYPGMEQEEQQLDENEMDTDIEINYSRIGRIGRDRVLMRNEELQNKKITRENFEAFWIRYKEEKIKAGIYSWMTAKSPFEV